MTQVAGARHEVRSIAMSLREEIRPLCDALVSGQKQILGEKLFGVYVFGAVTFPETTTTGDLDFHALLDVPPSSAEIDLVNALHDDMAQRFPPVGVGLDGYYLLLKDVQRNAPPRHQLRPDLLDNSWALHCAHIRAGRCIVLFGPDPATVYPEPTWTQIEEALAGELRYVQEHLSDYPDYCVLNLCRLMYSHQSRDVVVSKFGAGDWAIDAFPQWHKLIEMAKTSYAGQLTEEERATMVDQVPELHRFAVEEIERSRAHD